MDEIDKKIVKIFKETLGQEIDSIDFSKPIKHMSFLDSLSILDIISSLEKEFKISLPMDRADEIFFNINSLKKYVTSQTK